ncbi:putative inorganic phosphate cotransporter isoform X2 [Sabethes cyaneus]|uniref:putative inorganic phosphate cotransporter isoform X2 n=1 Tax=Sabethes cyaneus TaxID=53552 RepID=UPI00221E2D88|nr:putative inorganic phosphate cotransporter isoform X2 [Sabethes cyaneus]XP_053689626.1 putative inorganic phosphate cotransporter isoform X2 [Sabethes cyaneus]
MTSSKEFLAEDELQQPKGRFGTRHYVVFMLFLGMANAYVMRTNMSVAIVAMVNQTAIAHEAEVFDDECPDTDYGDQDDSGHQDGEFLWSTSLQGYILSSFFYGYVITQIPFGLLAKRYGAMRFLGWGMLINSVFAFLVPVAARQGGAPWLIVVRFIQGLGEGPIVPCTHAMLAKWIPPNERSRVGSIVYSGAQFGTVISMPLSGLLSDHGFDGGWPSIFYVFGIIGTVWSVAFLFTCHEDPITHPTIREDERKYIQQSVWGKAGVNIPPIPWKSILCSMPFYAILLAHLGQNYGYETLMTELPTYMKQVLRFSIKANGTLSALPYLAMWLFSIVVGWVADWMLSSGRFTHTITRKISNSIGQYGPAIALIVASYTGCNRALTVAILTIGIGLNGGIYAGFKINHLDITPRYAGILMAITNCSANLAGLLAPIAAGNIIEGKPTIAQWRIVFVIAAGVYIFTATFFNIFASGTRQPWDNPDNDEPQKPASIEAASGTYENGHAHGNGTTPTTTTTTATYRNVANEQRQL